MKNLYKIFFNKLNEIFSINELSKYETHNGDLLLKIERLEDNPDYFFVLRIIECNKKSNDYTEMDIRIWNHKLAEILTLKQAHFGIDQEVYVKRFGLEANPIIRDEVNRFFLSWLNCFPKDINIKITI